MTDVSMLYGTRREINNTASAKIASGTLEYVSGAEEESVTINFVPDAIYLLFCSERTTSSGAQYGNRIIMINTPTESLFGTTACSHPNVYTSSNIGVTLTWDDDSTLTIAPASGRTVTYSVWRFA